MSDPNQEEVSPEGNIVRIIEKNWFCFQIRRKRLARLAGSEPPSSPPEPPAPKEEPAPMEEDETQKACVTRSQSSVWKIFVF